MGGGSSSQSGKAPDAGASGEKYAIDPAILNDENDCGVEIKGDVVKQKVSVHHVVNNVYYNAPVRTSVMTYPETSAKKGESYIWIELNDREIDQEQQAAEGEEEVDKDWEKHKQSYPPGVSVDGYGNIFVAGRSGAPGKRISSDDVMAGFSAPLKPKLAPGLKSNTANTITISWDLVLGLVDVYEVQYRVALSESDFQSGMYGLNSNFRVACNWESLGQTAQPEMEVDYVQCGIPYVFRFRAHNSLDWGPYSESSESILTRPERPAKPTAPYAQNGMVRFDRILMQWELPNENGSPILEYQVYGGAVKDEQVDLLYIGPANYAILTGLEHSTDYHYKINATNDQGTSDFSAYWQVRTPMKKPEDGMPKKKKILGPDDKVNNETWVCDWAEVLDHTSFENIYVNIDNSKVSTERPNDMDGPIDEVAEFKKKRFRFNKELLKDAPKGWGQVLRLHINRDNLLQDSFEKLLEVTSVTELQKRIKIEYLGEEGIDAGGLSKDWFLEVSRQLFREETGLFTRVGDSPAVDINVNGYGPKGGSYTEEEVLAWYCFVGRVLGKSIFDRQIVEVQFSTTLFKQLLGQEVDVDDLRETDPTLVKSMEWMLENDIEYVIFEEFCVSVNPPPGSKAEPTIYDLIPGGRNIEVTNENKADYVEKMLKWRAVDSCKLRIDAIRSGLFEIVPEELLRSANYELFELEMLWNGFPYIDVQEIRNTCIFQGGFDNNHKIVHWFWKFFKELDTDDQSVLLKFVTGTSKLPLDGLDPPFNLTFNEDMDPESLPKSHSCFNQLVLCNYRTEEVMREKIIYAMRNADGFLLS